MFKLIALGQGEEKSLVIAESVTLQQNQNEDTVFKIQLSEREIKQNRFLKLEAIALTGACEIYVSSTSKEPSFEDNEGMIVFQDSFENNINAFSR